MRTASWLFVGAFALSVVGVATLSVRPTGAAGTGPLITMVSPPNDAAVRRLRYKAAVARRLIDGQTTLLEAAAWTRRLDAELPLPARVLLPGEEEMSEEERACRQVIRWVEAAARHENDGAPESAARRLEAELEEMLKRGEGISLPPVE